MLCNIWQHCYTVMWKCWVILKHHNISMKEYVLFQPTDIVCRRISKEPLFVFSIKFVVICGCSFKSRKEANDYWTYCVHNILCKATYVQWVSESRSPPENTWIPKLIYMAEDKACRCVIAVEDELTQHPAIFVAFPFTRNILARPAVNV